MVTMQCSSCGLELEMKDVGEPGQPVACPRCGELAVTASSTTPLGPLPGLRNKTAADGDGEDYLDETQARPARPLGSPPRPASGLLGPAAEAQSWLAPPQAPDEIGRLAHYRALGVLGKGGMGVVFKAEDLRLQRTVALKVMSPALAQDATYRQRFLREARAMAALRSEHIVTVHEVGQDRDLPYLSMELLQGERLDVFLKRTPRPPVEQVVRIGTQIARGLAAAHEAGLIHRDVKPANIWMEAPSGRVKILDFGLARAVDDDTNLTQAGMMMGTPAYMPPEQADGEPVDQRGDLFSLGCVLYQLATGVLPFTGKSTMSVLKAVCLKDPTPPREIDPTMPPALADLILHLLAKKPGDRPASAAAVVAALESIFSTPGAPVQAPAPRTDMSTSEWAPAPAEAAAPPPPGAQPAAPGESGSGRLLLIGVFALLVVGLAGLAVELWSRRGGRPGPVGPALPEVVFGMSAPLDGPYRELGKSMKDGITAYFEHRNGHGGVAGHRLRLVARDDGYNPARALDNMRKLHEEDGVFGFLGNVGTPTARVTVPYAEAKKKIFFGPFTGATFLREPVRPLVFNYRASYAEETAAIVKYLLAPEGARLKPEQIAVFAQNDSYGEDGFRGVARALAMHGIAADKILRVGYAHDSIDVDEAARVVIGRPDIRAVAMVAVYDPAAQFIHRVKRARRDVIFTNVSFVGGQALAHQLGRFGKGDAAGVIITQVVPFYGSELTGAADYRGHLEKYVPGAEPGFGSLEGYLAAQLLVRGLKPALERPEGLTTEGLREALEALPPEDPGIGVELSFSPRSHQASHRVWGSVLGPDGQPGPLDLHGAKGP